MQQLLEKWISNNHASDEECLVHHNQLRNGNSSSLDKKIENILYPAPVVEDDGSGTLGGDVVAASAVNTDADKLSVTLWRQELVAVEIQAGGMACSMAVWKAFLSRVQGHFMNTMDSVVAQGSHCDFVLHFDGISAAVAYM